MKRLLFALFVVAIAVAAVVALVRFAARDAKRRGYTALLLLAALGACHQPARPTVPSPSGWLDCVMKECR